MRKFAMELATRTLKLTQEFSLTAHQVLITSHLRDHASMLGSQNLFVKYQRAHREALETLQAEGVAAEEQGKVTLLFARSITEKPHLADRFANAADHVELLATRYRSFDLDMSKHRLKMASHQIALRFDATLEACDRACTELSEQWPQRFDAIRLGEINIMRLMCAAHLADLSRAKELHLACLTSFQASTTNWFSVQESFIHALLQCGKFDEARTIHAQVIHNERFGILPVSTQNLWRLFELLLLLAEPISRARSSASVAHFEKLSGLETDKQGYKACLLVLQVLDLLQRGKHEGIGEMIEPLKSYRQRHFKKRDKSPGSAMIDLIVTATDLNFAKEQVLRAVGALQEQLHAPITYLTRADGFVLLPFHWVWEEMVKHMPEEVEEDEAVALL